MGIQPLPTATTALTQGTAQQATSRPAQTPATVAQQKVVAPENGRAVQPTSDQLREVVDELKRYVEPMAQNLQFTIDEETGKTIVKLIDADTQEVLRQIPSEELVAIAKALQQQRGALIERKA